jgi:hypothetical protein
VRRRDQRLRLLAGVDAGCQFDLRDLGIGQLPPALIRFGNQVNQLILAVPLPDTFERIHPSAEQIIGDPAF